MKVKVHCQKCGLYLGCTQEEDFPVQLTCPICEESAAYVTRHLCEREVETEYPTERSMSWLGDVFQRAHEDDEARCLVRLMMERREGDFYEFPPLWKSGNGVAR